MYHKYASEHVHLVLNPDYKFTSSMGSLACAAPYIKEDFLLVEGDTFYEYKVLKALSETKNENCFAITEESPRRKMKPVFLVFCEGETEETYLDHLKQAYRSPIKIIPKVEGGDISQRLIDARRRELKISKNDGSGLSDVRYGCS